MVVASVDVSTLIRAKLRKTKYVYKMYHPSFISTKVEIIVHRIVHFVLAVFENIFNNVIKWNLDHGRRELVFFSRVCTTEPSILHANWKFVANKTERRSRKMKSKQWIHLAAHINNISSRFGLNERKSKSVQIIHCHGWQWSCVRIYYTYLYVSHYVYLVCGPFNVVLHRWSCDYTAKKWNWIQTIDAASAKLEVIQKIGQNRIFISVVDVTSSGIDADTKHNARNFQKKLSSWVFVICSRFHIFFTRCHELMGITQLEARLNNVFICFVAETFRQKRNFKRKRFFLPSIEQREKVIIVIVIKWMFVRCAVSSPQIIAKSFIYFVQRNLENQQMHATEKNPACSLLYIRFISLFSCVSILFSLFAFFHLDISISSIWI